MLTVILFDVDHTLTCSEGVISESDLKILKSTPNIIVGLCGNLNKFCTSISNWWEYVSVTTNFDTGPYFGGLIPKEIWLRMFKETCYPHADRYILVGNRMHRPNRLGIVAASDDEGAAQRAGWEFILEDDWNLDNFI